jgi:plastocyanin/mono/diheme cytochrome c family protein
MITPLMSRPAKVLLTVVAAIAATGLATACGTEKIGIAKDNPNHTGAVLFNQRCGGCHTLSYAVTHGSAANVRSAQIVNGPNFDVRCERPVTRVLYAIQNGGFSGATMPQNVVVGPQAIDVAKFVASYAGRQAKTSPGVGSCQQQPIGTIPNLSATATTPSTNTTPSSTTPTTTTPTTTTPTTTTSTTTTPTTSTSGGSSISEAANPTGQLKFTKSSLSTKAGKVTINFTNKSPLPHNMTIQQGTNGSVIGATPTFSGATKKLTVTLKPGKYTFYCSVPGHRQAGMQGTLTVR